MHTKARVGGLAGLAMLLCMMLPANVGAARPTVASASPAVALASSTPVAAQPPMSMPLSRSTLAETTGGSWWSFVGCALLGGVVGAVATPWVGVPVGVACRVLTSPEAAY
jgi:hypothetical protein